MGKSEGIGKENKSKNTLPPSTATDNASKPMKEQHSSRPLAEPLRGLHITAPYIWR
jgi:hypothetical protein